MIRNGLFWNTIIRLDLEIEQFGLLNNGHNQINFKFKKLEIVILVSVVLFIHSRIFLYNCITAFIINLTLYIILAYLVFINIRSSFHYDNFRY